MPKIPYDEKDEVGRGSRRPGDYDLGSDINHLVNNAVRFGTSVGSTVLGSISDALGNAFGGSGEPPTLAQWRRKLDRRLKNGRQGNALGLAICGWTFAGMFGIAALVMAILWAVGAGPLGLGPEEFMVFPILTAVFAPLTAGFSVMGAAGVKRYNYFARLRKYVGAARDWVSSVADIARDTMLDPARVRAELRRGVAEGDLPGACLDETGGTLYLDNTLYTPQPEEPQRAEAPQQETPADAFAREGAAFLRYLGACRGRLGEDTDVELAAMAKTCGAIMGFVHNHPDQINRVRKFREYYLPTTKKLLDTAQGLGGADTENAQAIRRDITGILHTLNMAYTKLYDGLLQDVSMDVSAEIDVLETMLNQDGLTHDFKSDFGAESPKP